VSKSIKPTRKIAKTKAPPRVEEDDTETEEETGSWSGIPPERLDAIEMALAQCIRHQTIQSQFARQWEVTRRTIRRYIRAIYDRWETESKKNRVLTREQMRAALQDLFARASMDGQLKIAVDAADRLCRLEGFYEDKMKIQHSGAVANTVPVLDLSKLSNEELAALDAITAKASPEE
jgi:hypothetical protein